MYAMSTGPEIPHRANILSTGTGICGEPKPRIPQKTITMANGDMSSMILTSHRVPGEAVRPEAERSLSLSAITLPMNNIFLKPLM